MSKDAQTLKNRFDVDIIDQGIVPIYHANGFTHPMMPILTYNKISQAQWGLVPNWIKTTDQAKKIMEKTLNARSETIFSKPSFKASILNKRCIIPATGYFEWQHKGKEKIPYFIHSNSTEILSFAGIYTIYSDENETKATFSIITTPANDFTAKIHNSKKRMPLILHQEDEDKWLNTKDQRIINALLNAYNSELSAHQISPAISNPNINTNNPFITERYRPNNQQQSLF